MAASVSPGAPRPWRLDAYLIWHLLRGGFGEQDLLHVLVELADRFDTALAPAHKGLYLPSHTHCLETGPRRTRFQAALVDREGLVGLLGTLAAGTSPTRVLRWELAFSPMRTADSLEATVNVAVQRSNPPSAARIELKDIASHLANQVRMKIPGEPLAKSATSHVLPRVGVRVCVIDDGCNFASSTLENGRPSRIEQLFVQSIDSKSLEELDETGLYDLPFKMQLAFPPTGPVVFSIRGCFTGLRLDPSRVITGSLTDEPGAYRSTRYLHPPRRATHGAAVLGLIASPWLRICDKLHWRPYPDTLLFAQLPSPTVEDTSGASLSAHALDAIHDALDRTDDDHDLIVNLSFGSHSGPHDGTSMFESAMLELLDTYDGGADVKGKRLIVVLPAGNSHRARCHASGYVNATSAQGIDWKLMPDDDTDNFVEIWVPRGAGIKVDLTSPEGNHPYEVRSDDGPFDIAIIESGDQVHGMVLFVRDPPQSEHSSLILLALGGQASRAPGSANQVRSLLNALLQSQVQPQAARSGRAEAGPSPRAAAHGIWHIQLEGTTADDVPWHAYVQRGDVAPLRRRAERGVRSRQSSFVDTEGSPVDPLFTLNGIATATHPRLFVAGALNRNDGGLSDYSASGPSRIGPTADAVRRVFGPDMVVAADESIRRRGLLTHGVLGGGRIRQSGTSMAAATLTRHLWEHLSAKRPLESFRGPAPELDTLGPIVPAGAPSLAPDFTRGETTRVLSRRLDDSLG